MTTGPESREEFLDAHLPAAAYALDALDEHETAAFEVHLQQCASCQETVDEFRATAARLGETTSMEPPAAMRSAVLQAISSIPQLPADKPEAAPADAVVVDLAQRRPRGRAWTALVGIAAAVSLLAALGAGTWALSLRSEVQDGRALAASITAVLTAPDASRVDADVRGGGRTAVITSPTAGTVLVATDLPALGSGRTYQTWWVTGAGATSAGLMPVGADGSAAITLSGTPAGVTAVAVSVEPAGGSTSPTTDPIAVLAT